MSEHETVMWPKVTAFAGGGNPEGAYSRITVQLEIDTNKLVEVEYVRKDDADRWRERSERRLKSIEDMSFFLDHVAEALYVAKPSTPIEGVGACFKIIAAIQELQSVCKLVTELDVTGGGVLAAQKAAMAILERKGDVKG